LAKAPSLDKSRGTSSACYGAVAENVRLPITLKRPVRDGSGASELARNEVIE
jgi:hypothetical protein